tara:strand:- start:89 stop:268 length:180 start_codon:yes stop_codon:yes gene_type:complete
MSYYSSYLYQARQQAWKIIHAKESWKKSSLMNELVNGTWKYLTKKEKDEIIELIKREGK